MAALVAAEVGEHDPDRLAAKVEKLWPYTDYLAKYRRGRTRPRRKAR